MRVDISKWATRNVWPLPSGQLAVRPGLREVYEAASGRKIVGGFTVKNPYVDDVQHWVFDVSTSGALDLKLRVLDQFFVEWQVLTVGAHREPAVITHAIVGDELLVCSPDFASIMGIVGGGAALAQKKATTSSNFTAIEIPRGIAVTWQDRVVIANGPTLYFSEPQTPRTFLSASFVVRSAPIYGLHVAADGALVICQRDGVFTLPADAAASGTLVFGVVDKLTDYESMGYEQTCISRGGLFGLTQRGLRRLDGRGESVIDDPPFKCPSPRYALPDYRDGGRLFGGEAGPIVAATIGYDSVWNVGDLARGFRSWWEPDGDQAAALRGLLYTFSGEQLYLTETGIRRCIGNTTSESLSSQPNGAVFGRIPMSPALSPVVRGVRYATDALNTHFHLGDFDSGLTMVQDSPVADTHSWGAVIGSPRLHSGRLRLAERVDDLDILITVQGPLLLLPTEIELETRGIGRRRP
jgi:hypothetical protein